MFHGENIFLEAAHSPGGEFCQVDALEAFSRNTHFMQSNNQKKVDGYTGALTDNISLNHCHQSYYNLPAIFTYKYA